jgi:hypothetical protein
VFVVFVVVVVLNVHVADANFDVHVASVLLAVVLEVFVVDANIDVVKVAAAFLVFVLSPVVCLQRRWFSDDLLVLTPMRLDQHRWSIAGDSLVVKHTRCWYNLSSAVVFQMPY